jgi:hypothetical protein
MRRLTLTSAMLAALAALMSVPASADDRVLVSGNVTSLTGTDGGGSGSVGYLHDLSAASILGLGVEYDTIANSHWTFGTVSGSLTGGPAREKWAAYAEVHQGSGATGPTSFTYGVYALGGSETFAQKFTVQLETRQFEVGPTNGNLPKINLSYLFTPQYMLSAFYAKSVSGNLGTELYSARLDHYGHLLNWLIGAAGGQAAPAVLNLQGATVIPAPQLHEGYVGISKRFENLEVALLGDYQDLSGIHRVTTTLTFTYHLFAPRPSK